MPGASRSFPHVGRVAGRAAATTALKRKLADQRARAGLSQLQRVRERPGSVHGGVWTAER